MYLLGQFVSLSPDNHNPYPLHKNEPYTAKHEWLADGLLSIFEIPTLKNVYF